MLLTKVIIAVVVSYMIGMTFGIIYGMQEATKKLNRQRLTREMIEMRGRGA